MLYFDGYKENIGMGQKTEIRANLKWGPSLNITEAKSETP